MFICKEQKHTCATHLSRALPGVKANSALAILEQQSIDYRNGPPADGKYLTVIIAKSGVLTKTHRETLEGVVTVSYGRSKYFTVLTLKWVDVNQFKLLLKIISYIPAAAIIRGFPKSTCPPTHARRTINDDQTTGESANFMDEPLLWMMIDVDGNTSPHAPSVITHPDQNISYYEKEYPIEIIEGDRLYQIGSSAGVKPSKNSVHIFMILESPVSGHQLKPYLKKHQSQHGFDPALAAANQIHFIADPIFINMNNPIAKRWILKKGSGPMPIEPIIAAHRAQKYLSQQEKMKMTFRMTLKRMTKPKVSTGASRRASVSDVLFKRYDHLITRTLTHGWIHCDCPCHDSQSHESLHINTETEQWKCHGCQKSGKGPWALVSFIEGAEDVSLILKEVAHAS